MLDGFWGTGNNHFPVPAGRLSDEFTTTPDPSRRLCSETAFGKLAVRGALEPGKGTVMDPLTVIIVIIAGFALWAVALYNRLVKKKNMVQEGWSGIDVQLKRRSNLIPNLIETVKGYLEHERDVLENVTELRTQSLNAGQPGQQGVTEGLLGAALGKLFAVAENYPDLKADQNFRELHESLDDVEEQIQLSRRYYNGAVRDLNILVESFPSNLVANAFKFQQAEFFELENAADRAVPEVSFD